MNTTGEKVLCVEVQLWPGYQLDPATLADYRARIERGDSLVIRCVSGMGAIYAALDSSNERLQAYRDAGIRTIYATVVREVASMEEALAYQTEVLADKEEAVVADEEPTGNPWTIEERMARMAAVAGGLDGYQK